jgi:hypothetical protein
MEKQYDVIIVGGGISGTMAAVAAARAGAKTLVIERYGFLGGMLTAAGVGPMMTFHAGDKQVIQGITAELITRLVRQGKSPGHIVDTTGYTYTVTPFDAEAMKRELETMVLESGGKILYHTMLASVDVNQRNIRSITVCNKAGLNKLMAKVYIDATGDADLSLWAGVECTKGRKTDGAAQPMTMKLRMTNVNIQAVREYIKANPDEFPRLKGNTAIIDKAPRLSIGGFVKTLKDAQEKGEITFRREDVLFFETNTPGEVIINTSRVLGCDSTDPWSLSEAEVEGRKQALELEKFLKKRIPGFENAQVEYTGPFIGVRSSNQIVGMYTLTVEDLIACKRFEDTIAHAGYPVDIHSPDGEGTLHRHLKWGDMYSIPYRCVINPKVDNLITVGRCISATFEAQAGIRTTPTCGAIGHAGGVAAAIAADKGSAVQSVNIDELQSLLKEQGAYL